MWDYFNMIEDEQDIDVVDMYGMFVMGWNGDLAENNPFSKDFKRCSAQMLVILMDTLDVLLGRTEIGDDSLLLNDDGKIWGELADAKCWGDMKERQNLP